MAPIHMAGGFISHSLGEVHTRRGDRGRAQYLQRRRHFAGY